MATGLRPTAKAREKPPGPTVRAPVLDPTGEERQGNSSTTPCLLLYSRSTASGDTWAGPWIRTAPPSISCCEPTGTRLRHAGTLRNQTQRRARDGTRQGAHLDERIEVHLVEALATKNRKLPLETCDKGRSIVLEGLMAVLAARGI